VRDPDSLAREVVIEDVHPFGADDDPTFLAWNEAPR